MMTKSNESSLSSTKYLIVIGGPTAVGKTEAALHLAITYDCPIISSDSRQLYKEMNIGTAKPSKEELSLAEHHFINHLSIHDAYSVGDYEREVIEKLNELYKTYDKVIMVGGTGLYINAVLNGLDDFPDVDPKIRGQYKRIFKLEGIGPLQEAIKEKDPEYASKVDIDNPHRLIRALSVIDSSGQLFSSLQSNQKKNRPFTPIKIALTMERHLLYVRINKRVDHMMDMGLEAEARSLHQHKELNALNTVGYSELFDHFDGKCFLSESIEKIKQNTRNYAKRQSTWFRNQGEWAFYSNGDLKGMELFVGREIEENN